LQHAASSSVGGVTCCLPASHAPIRNANWACDVPYICYQPYSDWIKLRNVERRSLYPPSLSLSLSIYIYIQPFGLWPLFQFLNPIHNRQDSLDGGSACHKAATYTENNTNRINAYRHPCLEWNSIPKSKCSSR
jgi:hypothetical protein